MIEETQLCHAIPQDPAIVEALRPGKEELDRERLEVIGQSGVKLFTTRQVLEGHRVERKLFYSGRVNPWEPDHRCNGLGK